MTNNIKLLIEYDGTNYHGWQRQANLLTVQEVLEEVLGRITKQTIKVTGASRTDAGVHALGQSVSFKSNLQIDETSWVKAINSLLPHDIRIKKAEYVPMEFNARFSAKGKTYQYAILNVEQMSPFLRNYAWHIKRPLDIYAMKEAAGYLLGTHDFSSFRSSQCSAKSPVRTLENIEVAMLIPPPLTGGEKGEGELRVFPDNPLILLTFEARSFLQHMVRNIVGTLVEVGRGRFKPADVKNILEKKDRRHAGQIAPSQGLFLVKIKYG
ncbi:MAG: tRNA pseudouridine(38-40) synthase TruA [Nitrospirae bacterium]|nr:tRNA pseudouridine(38-40) synthase TruA [Nitrospirota bacterium]